MDASEGVTHGRISDEGALFEVENLGSSPACRSCQAKGNSGILAVWDLDRPRAARNSRMARRSVGG